MHVWSFAWKNISDFCVLEMHWFMFIALVSVWKFRDLEHYWYTSIHLELVSIPLSISHANLGWLITIVYI
jgi:hypothetical protein